MTSNEEEELCKDNAQVMKTKGVSVTWKNLRVIADIKTQNVFRKASHNFKEIIHNVNGYVEPSNLVAILGASGSGKSTLMSVLANRHPKNLKVDGDVHINGQKNSPASIKRVSGFVYQDDLFVPTFTSLEHLHFAVQLKLDKKITTEYRKKLVNELLIDFGLAKCANRPIGSSNYGKKKMNLSAGELKRLSVATELLTNPPLLFCDEPTTGLDSFTALKLMTIMKKLTNDRGKTIICSIHQPSERIFDLFHQIILLCNGKIAFSGNSKDALSFFQSAGFIYDEEQNPADYLVRSLAIIPGQELETVDKTLNICIKFEESRYAKYVYEQIERETCKKVENYLSEPGNIERISWFYKLYLMTYREIMIAIRDPFAQKIKTINKAALGLILGILVMGSITMTQEGMQALKAMIFLMVTENSFPSMESIVDHFPEKMPLFLREYSNNMNTPLIFYLSNIISLVPGFLIDPILYVSLMYVLLELKKTWFAFLATIIINVIVFNTAALFGICMSLATNSVSMAQSINISVGLVYMTFAGIFLNVRSIPWIFSWIRYVSWMTYAVESLLILQLEGVDEIQCSKASNVPCLRNGTEVLKSLGFDEKNLNWNVTMICYIYLVLQGLSFFTLKIRLYFKTSSLF